LPDLTDREEDTARASRAEALGHAEDIDDDLVCSVVKPVPCAVPTQQQAWAQFRAHERDRARRLREEELARREARAEEAIQAQADAEAEWHAGGVITDTARVAGAFPQSSRTNSGAA